MDRILLKIRQSQSIIPALLCFAVGASETALSAPQGAQPRLARSLEQIYTQYLTVATGHWLEVGGWWPEARANMARPPAVEWTIIDRSS